MQSVYHFLLWRASPYIMTYGTEVVPKMVKFSCIFLLGGPKPDLGTESRSVNFPYVYQLLIVQSFCVLFSRHWVYIPPSAIASLYILKCCLLDPLESRRELIQRYCSSHVSIYIGRYWGGTYLSVDVHEYKRLSNSHTLKHRLHLHLHWQD